MTTTSDSAGHIDCPAFGLSPADLRSLRALASVWRSALTHIAEQRGSSGSLDAFFELAAELPLRIADVHWQEQWMQSCQELSGRDSSLAEILCLLNEAITVSEADLLGDTQQVGRIQIDLLSILRRSVIAVTSCAIDLREEILVSEAGLPGELALMGRLREMANADRQVAVLSMSIVNQRVLSHLSAGELQTIPGFLGEQVAGVLRPQDEVFVGHEGEWLLLLPDLRSLAQPVLASTQIHQAFAEPVALLSGRPVIFNIAIGAAMMPEHARDPAEVILAARLARTSLKTLNQKFAFFNDDLRQNWGQRYRLSEELRQALRKDALTVYLQPQVNLANGRCFGAELLLRWRRENGDWVAPQLIVDLVEENGWRELLSDWLIRAALRLSTELETVGVDISLSFNLTAEDLLDFDLPELLSQCLETWSVPASRFTIELTESVMMGDRAHGLAVMKKLRGLGARLALDDFGTGYSSLSYLASLPINEIKIDRSFVLGMSDGAEGLRIVRAIIDLAHDLGMSSLAEGVEDMAQRDQLRALGCMNAQGHLYGKAMPFDEFVAWYKAYQA
jgi:EAL domain-containing protein (putative c-di-GMP-specific phosphodiesterase class I)